MNDVLGVSTDLFEEARNPVDSYQGWGGSLVSWSNLQRIRGSIDQQELELKVVKECFPASSLVPLAVGEKNGDSPGGFSIDPHANAVLAVGRVGICDPSG